MGEDKKEKKSKKKKEKTEEAPAEEAPADAPAAEAPKKKTGNVFALFNQSQIQEFKEAFTMMDQNRDGIICEEDLAAIYQQVGREPDEAQLKAMIAESSGQLNFTHFLTLFGEKTHGRDPDPKQLKEMIGESPGQLNFTHFLTLFGEKLHGRDPNPEMLKSMVSEAPGALNFTQFLSLFGDKLKGTDPESRLRDAFTLFDPENTCKMSEEYFKDLLMNVGDLFSKDEIKQVWKEAPFEGGQLDYMKFVTIIKRGKEDE